MIPSLPDSSSNIACPIPTEALAEALEYDVKPSLIYTAAFDPAGSGGTRQMVKMLEVRVERTYFTADIVILRNSGHPVFIVPRPGLEETYVETSDMEH